MQRLRLVKKYSQILHITKYRFLHSTLSVTWEINIRQTAKVEQTPLN
jgi:hypothetical protein